MQRRTILKSLALLPAVKNLAAAPAPPAVAKRAAPDDFAPLPAIVPDQISAPTAGFFSPEQFATLGHLSDILVPRSGDNPGALDAGVPAFLDFLIGESPDDRRRLYLDGLDRLNTEARRQYSSDFAELQPSQAGELLAPLAQPWTYEAPADRFARFLRAAKEDVIAGTRNSRERLAIESKRRGSRAGVEGYWRSIE